MSPVKQRVKIAPPPADDGTIVCKCFIYYYLICLLVACLDRRDVCMSCIDFIDAGEMSIACTGNGCRRVYHALCLGNIHQPNKLAANWLCEYCKKGVWLLITSLDLLGELPPCSICHIDKISATDKGNELVRCTQV